MATTITSNEGYNSSVSPDPTPEFKPSSFAENDSFEMDLLRPSIEAERKYQEEGLKIRRKNYETIKKHTLDFDNFEPEQTSEVRNRVLVSGYLDSQFSEGDRPSNDHDILRDSVAKHKFKGEGVGSDEAFVAAIRKDFEGENKKQEFYDDLDRKATLSAFMGGGAPKKEFQQSAASNPLAKSERLEINERWQQHQDAIEEEYGASMLFDIRTTFKEMQEGGDWLMFASNRAKDYTNEERTRFMGALRELSTAYPDQFASDSFMGNLLTGGGRGIGAAVESADQSMLELFRNARVGVHNVFVAPFAEVLGTDESREWSEGKREEGAEYLKQTRDAADFRSELASLYQQDYSPIQPLAPKDTALRAIEEGVYAAPGAVATSAMAAIPVVGMPMVFGTIREMERQKYRGEIIANGGTREQASELSGNMATVSAVPQMLAEKFQSFGLTGRVPGLDKVFGKVDDLITNRLARGTTKFAMGGLAETGVELGQEIISDGVQDLTAAFHEIVPDVEWHNGVDGHFDGYFHKFLSTAVAVSPLAVTVATGGLSQEKRAAAFKKASPLERKAFGFTEEANQAMEDAETPRQQVQALQQGMETRDAFSDEAREAVEELEEMEQQKARTQEEADRVGVSPSVRVAPDQQGFQVFDRLTGDTISDVETAQEATDEVFNQLQLKEQENRQYFQELLASFEAAALDVEQSGEAVEVGTGTFTDADAEAAMPGSDRRLQTERELLEQRDGGTGAVAREVMSEGQSGSIAGAYIPAGQMGRKEAVTQLHNGSSVLTLIHERGHAKRRKLMESGAWKREDQISSLRNLDNLIAQTEEKFLPENFDELNDYDQEVAIDEAIAELSEVLALNSRKGKNSKMGGLISRNLSAMVRARIPGATQLKSFLGSLREFFGLQLRRATILRKAVRDGNLDQAQVDQLTDMLVGTNSQEVFEQERDAIPVEMVDGQEVDTPFSPGDARMLSNITPAQDAEYMEAVESGDVETQQRMVDEAAKAAGYGVRAFHGTPDGRFLDEDPVFRQDFQVNNVQWFAEDKRVARTYADDRRAFDYQNAEPRTIPVYLSIQDPLEVDARGGKWRDAQTRGRTSGVIQQALSEGRDGVIIKNVQDDYQTGVAGKTPTTTTYSTFNSNQIKSADPVTYDEAGNVIPLSQRFDESRDEISFSPGDARMLSDLSENVMRRVRAPEARAVVFERLVDRIDALKRDVAKMIFGGAVEQEALPDARSMKSLKKEAAFRQADLREQYQAEKVKRPVERARTEANEWLEEQVAQQKKYYNPVARIRRSLVMYDAILKTLPPELRGKMGGFVQIAKLNSDKKRLEFLQEKVEQLDKEVDKWISGKHRKQIEKIFKANRPKKKSSGQSKVDSNFKHADLVMKIEKLSKLTREKVEAKILKIDGKLETETDEAKIQRLTEKRDNLAVFGNIDGMKANALGDFYQNLNTIHRQGKLLKAMSDEQFNQFLQETIDIVNNDVTGGQGEMTQSEAKLKDESRKARVIPTRFIGAEDVKIDGLSDFHRKNVSFEWLMNTISRANKSVGTLASETHKRLSTMVHIATHQEKRDNLSTQEQFREVLAGIFGVVAPGQTSINMDLTNKIHEMEKVEQTNISKMEYGRKGRSSTKRIPASKVQAILNGEATIEGLGISESDWAAIQARYTEIKESGKSIKPNTRVEYESQTEGEAKMMALSQSQAINLTMLWRQKGLKDSMEHEGYSDQTMKDMEEFLTPESKEIREWLTIQYEDNYHKINKVFRAQNGFSLPKTDFYSPAIRMAQKEAKDMSIDSEGRQAMSVDPNFTITRTTNRAPMDQTAGALSIWMAHSTQTNHYVAWADTVKVLRSVFSDQSVRNNIRGYVGRSALETIDERLEWFADGGNRKAKHIAALDKLRAAHTYGSLGFKWSIAMKQLTSLPAYAFDMSFKDFGKYFGLFVKDFKKNIGEMLDTPYVQTRFKSGYERDVMDGLRREGGSRFMKALQVGMLSGKAGDIVPVIIGGWMARQRSYDNAKKAGLSDADARKKSDIDFEMITDRAQQAGDMKDLSSFQGGGSMFKLFTMYKTSPRQYYANVAESFADAGKLKGLLSKGGKPGSKKEFARRFFIAQVMLPMTFQFVSDLTKAPFKMLLGDDDEEYISGENYLRAMLLGPLNGLFILGDGLEMLASGIADTTIWAKKITILDGVQEVAQGFGKLDATGLISSFMSGDDWDGDIVGAADKIARGMGRITPGAMTFYDIIRDEIKRLEGLTEVLD